jgi:hypothetical protein
MDTMAIPIVTVTIATGMIVPIEPIVTGIVVIAVQGVAPVIGDEIKAHGESL